MLLTVRVLPYILLYLHLFSVPCNRAICRYERFSLPKPLLIRMHLSVNTQTQTQTEPSDHLAVCSKISEILVGCCIKALLYFLYDVIQFINPANL